MKNILVIGSSNVDLIAMVDRFPDSGETVGNAVFSKTFGGKGANQAVAASRAGGKVIFVSSIGDDSYGKELKENLITNEINIHHTYLQDDVSTGVALILVDSKGENRIAVAPGANAKLTTDLVEEKLIESADILLMQLEIPYGTVREIGLLAKKHNTKLMLNPAPALALDEDLLQCVDFLVLNETEANMISGLSVASDGIEVVANKLLQMGSKMVIITLGKNGSFIYSENQSETIKSFSVNAVDSTGAGDTFCGTLAVGISNGLEITEAVRYASGAAAISVTKLGAQSSIPVKEEIDSFMDKNNQDVLF